MNKKLQVFKLKKLVGTNKDLFDFESEVDGRLTYEENRTRIISKLKKRGLLNSKQEKKGKFKAGDLMLKAFEIQKKRSSRSKGADSSKNAVKVFDNKTLTKKQFLKWKNNPNKYDIEEVDTKGYGKNLAKKIKGKKLSSKQLKDLLDDLNDI